MFLALVFLKGRSLLYQQSNRLSGAVILLFFLHCLLLGVEAHTVSALHILTHTYAYLSVMHQCVFTNTHTQKYTHSHTHISPSCFDVHVQTHRHTNWCTLTLYLALKKNTSPKTNRQILTVDLSIFNGWFISQRMFFSDEGRLLVWQQYWQKKYNAWKTFFIPELLSSPWLFI